MEDGEQTRKLFLGGLNYETTEDGLQTYFGQWGTLTDCVVMRFPDSGRSRGFGFVTFTTPEEADACFASSPHTIDGSNVEIKKATPKGEKGPAGPKGEVLRKLFIGGLNYETTDESLKTYFEQFGEVIDCIVMKYKDSERSRGFGFVTYSSTDMVDAVQQNRPHTIDGTKVETKRATPREEAGKPETGKTVKKIFVGGLKDDMTNEVLQEYFSQYGNVTMAEHLTEKETGRKRGFGFVEFDDYDPVDKVIQQPKHQINGQRVDIRKAIAKNELNSMKGGFGGGRGGRGGGGWGGNQGFGGGFGGGYGGNSWGEGANPWQTGGNSWGDQGNSWGGYMGSGGGWGGGYGSGGAGGAMRNSMGGGGNRSAPYSVGGRGGGRGGRGGGGGGGKFY